MSVNEPTVTSLLKDIKELLTSMLIRQKEVSEKQITLFEWAKEKREEEQRIKARLGTPVYPTELRPVPGINRPTEINEGFFTAINPSVIANNPDYMEFTKKIAEMIGKGEFKLPSAEEFGRIIKNASRTLDSYDKEQKDFSDSVIRRKPAWDYSKEAEAEEEEGDVAFEEKVEFPPANASDPGIVISLEDPSLKNQNQNQNQNKNAKKDETEEKKE